jgi:hypothetical protein
MRNNKLNKVKTFIEEHKKEIIILASGTILLGVGIVIGKKLFSTTEINIVLEKAKESLTPPSELNVDLAVGEVTHSCLYKNGTVEMMVENVNIADLGKCGEELIEKIPGVSTDDMVWMLMDIKKK